jgi:hypothetical protein
MKLGIRTMIALMMCSAMAISFAGCSDGGNAQIEPNPEAKVLTTEEREDYNQKQTDMMNPNK